MALDRIREALLRKAGLDEEQISTVVEAERESGASLDQVLQNKNIMSEEKVMEFFGDFLGLETLMELEGVAVPGDFINNVPVQFARTHGLIALGARGHVMRIATHRPLDVQPMDDLAAMMDTAN